MKRDRVIKYTALQLTKLHADLNKLNKRKLINIGNSLYLDVAGKNHTYWFYRYVSKQNQKRVKIKIGDYPAMSLADAATKADEFTEMRKCGLDPKSEKLKHINSLKKAAMKFGDIAREYFSQAKHNPRTIKGDEQRYNDYVHPHIGDTVFGDVTPQHLAHILEPIWEKKHETAQKIKRFLNAIYKFAIASGYYDGLNFADWNYLEISSGLARSSDVHEPGTMTSLAYSEVPEFVSLIKDKNTIGSTALLFAILTTLRTGTIKQLEWPDLDIKKQMIIIPKDKMKKGGFLKTEKFFCVPIVKQLIPIMKSYKKNHHNSKYIFHDQTNPDMPISENGMLSVIYKLPHKDGGTYKGKTTTHGFRTSVTTWAYEKDISDDKTISYLKNHKIEDKLKRSYTETTDGMFLFEKRKDLLQKWADYVMPLKN